MAYLKCLIKLPCEVVCWCKAGTSNAPFFVVFAKMPIICNLIITCHMECSNIAPVPGIDTYYCLLFLTPMYRYDVSGINCPRMCPC